ncbi:MAG TPA: hypothetical protein VF666_04220 [Pyrinomonadaceae bacterium]
MRADARGAYALDVVTEPLGRERAWLAATGEQLRAPMLHLSKAMSNSCLERLDAPV